MNQMLRVVTHKNRLGHFNFTQWDINLGVLSSIFIIVFLIKTAAKLNQQYPLDEKDLSDSYLTQLIGIKRDAHDGQWESFRSNIFIMLGFMFGWKILHSFVSFFRTQLGMIVVGGLFILYSYRGDFLFYMSFLAIWYLITKYCHKWKYIVLSAWVTTVTVLYFNQKYDHFRFLSRWLEVYIPIQFLQNHNAPILWTNMLNMTLLKLLSFTIDCQRGDESQQYVKHSQGCQQNDLCYKCRDLFPLPQINFLNFIEYLFFVPTFFAGPPIAYKNYHSFKTHPSEKRPEFLRVFLDLICLEFFNHLVHLVHPNAQLSFSQLWIISLSNLAFIWLKFTVIWKVAKLWAMMLGVDVIDNMGRCMFNNYGFQKFWRMWHKGFNHWLIRYLYIPLGGNKSFLSVAVVIAFVAFWHDHTVNILVWAFILVLFMVPELIVKNYFRKHYSHLYPRSWFKYTCAFLCSLHIQIICGCNLIGFKYSLEQAKQLFEKIPDQIGQVLLVQSVLTSVAILQFYIRQIDGKKD